MKLILFNLVILALSFGSGQELGKLPRDVSSSSLSVIHGKKVSIRRYPFMASFSLGGWYGSGVVLNEHWILTTAFNVAWYEVDEIQFRVGSSKLNKGGQLLQAKKVICHENYTGTWDWDIAVVKVKKPIKFSKMVKSAKIATTEVKKGTKAEVAGWGEAKNDAYTPSENLLRGKVTVQDKEVCSNTYGSDFTARLMCTFDKKDGPCVYDYGDPLVVKGVVHGLYAGADGCTPGTNPVLYTDVYSLHKWVEKTIKDNDM